MKCPYCQQKIKRTAEIGDDKVSYINYLCEVCHVDYEYIVRPGMETVLLEETLFAINIKDQDFEVRFHHNYKQTSIYTLTWVKAVSKHGGSTPIKQRDTFHTFNYLLNWTPFNAKDKLILLLPFF